MSSPPRSPRAQLARDALVCLSLANLLFLRSWAQLLDPATSYFLEEQRPESAYLGAVLFVSLLALTGLAIAVGARRSGRIPRFLAEAVFALATGAAIYGTRAQITDFLGALHKESVRTVCIAVALVVIVSTITPWRARIRHAATTGLLVLSPFVAVTFAQSLQSHGGPVLEARPSATRSPDDPQARRVVILVFDEMDQLIPFEERPSGISLPAFDALAANGYHATRVRHPANKTEIAIPTLLTGRRVVRNTDAGTSDRILHFADGTTANFSDVETIFTDARKAGRDAGIAGWYHPYCREIGDDTASCYARSNRREMQGMTLPETLVRHLGVTIESLPQGRQVTVHLGLTRRRITSMTPEWHRASFEKIHAEAKKLARDPRLELVFLHYPVPHVPGIWSAATDAFSAGGKYADNLELADQSLADIRKEIDASGAADRTTVIALADHPKRGKGYLPKKSTRLPDGWVRPIPFFVKLPDGGAAIVDSTHRFSSVVLRELVRRLTEGSITTNEDLAAFFATAPQDPAPGETP